MKNNIWIQLVITISSFLILWGLLAQINFVRLFKVEENNDKLEEKLGEMSWESISSEEEIYSDSLVSAGIDKMVEKICEANEIDAEKIKVHLLDGPTVNAFALPDDHLVLFRGLLELADKPEKISGVIGHEIAHMEQNHIMKKLVKEIGLSVLLTLVSGNSNAEIINELTKMLTSSAYDRTLESEADMFSVQYLQAAKIDPEPFADFLYEIALEGPDLPDAFYWISTHPESKERSKDILAEIEGDDYIDYEPIFTDQEWEDFQDRLNN